MDDDMCYVAEDPNHPGTAWAISVDNPKYRKETAKDIADWIKRGAIVKRVDRHTSAEMMRRWLAIVDAEKHRQPDLFVGS